MASLMGMSVYPAIASGSREPENPAVRPRRIFSVSDPPFLHGVSRTGRTFPFRPSMTAPDRGRIRGRDGSLGTDRCAGGAGGRAALPCAHGRASLSRRAVEDRPDRPVRCRGRQGHVACADRFLGGGYVAGSTPKRVFPLPLGLNVRSPAPPGWRPNTSYMEPRG